MKKIIFPALCLAACIVASSISIITYATSRTEDKEQSANSLNKEMTVAVGTFNKIDTEGVNIRLTIGEPSASGTLTGKAEKISEVEIKNENGTLKVSYTGHSHRRQKGSLPTLTVSTASIKDIEASLAAKVTVDGDIISDYKVEVSTETAANVNIGTVSAPKLSLETETASAIQVVCVRATELECEAETASKISVAGTCTLMKLSAETAAKISATEMKADATRAEASTAGSISCPQNNITFKKETGGRISAN